MLNHRHYIRVRLFRPCIMIFPLLCNLLFPLSALAQFSSPHFSISSLAQSLHSFHNHFQITSYYFPLPIDLPLRLKHAFFDFLFINCLGIRQFSTLIFTNSLFHSIEGFQICNREKRERERGTNG